MKRPEAFQLTAYAVAGLLSVGSAFLISLKFIGHTHAQEQEAQPPQQQSQQQQQQMEPPPPQQQPPSPPPPAAQGAPGQQAQPMQQQPPPPGGFAPPPPGMQAQSGPGNDLSELEGFLEPFIYDQTNRRDPFQAWAEYVPTPSGPARPLSPAQRYDIDQLRLVGIMWDVRDPKAMFMDPDSEVIVLGRDEGIGNKNGYIASIREGEVVVVEATRKRGDVIYKTRTLRIER